MRLTPAVSLAAVTALLAAGAAAPARAQSDPALKKASEARNAARQAGHAKDWAKYTTDDFVLVQPDGSTLNKQERMREIEAHSDTASAAAGPADCQWRMYGGATAVSICKLGTDAEPVRGTALWVKRRATWQVASVQLTRIAKP